MEPPSESAKRFVEGLVVFSVKGAEEMWGTEEAGPVNASLCVIFSDKYISLINAALGKRRRLGVMRMGLSQLSKHLHTRVRSYWDSSLKETIVKGRHKAAQYWAWEMGRGWMWL
jgi:hypothetical protein